MADKNFYNTYIVNENLTLIEVYKKKFENKTYMFLLQQQPPFAIVVGYFDNKVLTIVEDQDLMTKVMVEFLKDENCQKALQPFVDALNANENKQKTSNKTETKSSTKAKKDEEILNKLKSIVNKKKD